MKIADDLRAAAATSLVRSEQRFGVYLKMASSALCNILRQHGLLDEIPLTQKQATNFLCSSF